MQEAENESPPLGKLATVVVYAIGIALAINLFISLELFFIIVLPDFGRGTFWHYVRLAIVLAIAKSVFHNLEKNLNLLVFLSFNIFLLIVNVYAIYSHWFAH